MRLTHRLFVLALSLTAATSLSQAPTWKAQLTPTQKSVLDMVSADSLKGHLAFLSSDLLEGRNTPSKGLDIAAEYIAAQFRRSGLQAPIAGSYFQEARLRARGNDVVARNVVAVLPGSDPKLKDTYVMVSAHYDHIGMNPNLEGDNIFNGANDNGSGTVAVIELAAALSRLDTKPKRSIVFVLFCGEEKGLLGSRYYGANPVFPLSKTVAQINLEQIGRTDDNEGPRVSAASMTGFDYSDVGAVFASVGEASGVPVTKHPRNSDAFFGRSDNQALADQGVPAHTISTAYTYPDYHGVGDHWEKIDFSNFQKVTRMIGAGLLTLADSDREPRWNEGNPRTQKYVAAWKRLKGL